MVGKNILPFLLVIVTIGVAPAAPRPPEPAALTVSHDVTWNGVHIAVMKEHYERQGDSYRIVSESTPVGLFALVQRRPVNVTSTGSVTDKGLRPERFDGARGPADARRVSAEFDWEAQRLALTHDGRHEWFRLPAATQDRLSIMYQFMFFDYRGREYIEFAMTNGRKLDHYRYAITRDVEIDTPLGRMATLHLVKQRESGDSETEIWLAPEHFHLPVKMRIVESDGARYEQVMTRLDPQP